MSFRLDDTIILEEIQKAEYIDENGDTLFVIESSDEFADQDYAKVKKIVDKYINRLNSVEQIFDADNLTKTLLKCESDNIAFITIEATQNTVLDRTGTCFRTIFKNDHATIYYPYIDKNISDSFFESDGDYVVVYDEYRINLLANLISDFDSRLNNDFCLQPDCQDNCYELSEEESDAPDRRENYFESSKEEQKLPDIKPVECEISNEEYLEPIEPELPDKESITKFITDIGVSVAMLKDSINIEPSCNYYWEKLECIVNLKSIMNKAVGLLKEI